MRAFVLTYVLLVASSKEIASLLPSVSFDVNNHNERSGPDDDVGQQLRRRPARSSPREFDSRVVKTVERFNVRRYSRLSRATQGIIGELKLMRLG